MVLEPGDSVPAISATNQRGEGVTVTFRAPTVLFFYPRDGTSECETEITQFDAALENYQEFDIRVYGISTDSVDAHRAVADEHDLEIPLLSDPDANIADAFGVTVTDAAAARTTFVCARGQVCGVYEGVRPHGHARSVLADIIQLGLIEPEQSG